MLLPQTTGSISSGTLLVLMSLVAKRAKLQAMHDIVTIENMERYLW